MELFKSMLAIDSTSGKEEDFALWCRENLKAPQNTLMRSGNAVNLLLKWGANPKIVFCTHLDTVPPYIAPSIEGAVVRGRGACDAKGQIYSMYKACKALEAKGFDDFALLLLSGEETGSYGAKAFAKTDFRAPYLVIGEPTENKMVKAAKGTKSFDLHFEGEPFHSGYPENGHSAVEHFVDFNNMLRAFRFPEDDVLGESSYNFGLLQSDNPQNILSPGLDCRLYFRTTFETDEMVVKMMIDFSKRLNHLKLSYRGGDTPAVYHTVKGLPECTVAFGSDAPHLSNFEKKMICGPGSIMTAHRDDEQITLEGIEEAVNNYIFIYENCN